MKKLAFVLLPSLLILSGKVDGQCIGNLSASISGGSNLICYNTSPGTFTATGQGESGTYTYLWYKNGISTEVTTQTYSPGILTSNTTVYCDVMSGTCGPASTPTISITVAPIPTAPVVGTVTQPTCTVSTGSVPLSGLPDFGDWLVTINPGGGTKTGNGTSTTITGLQAGTTYTFTVTNYAGCVSPASSQAVIQAQPATPSAPLVGPITAPTCTVPTGSVILNGLPGAGTWTLRRYPGGIITTGSGSSTTVSGLSPGTYNFSVTNSAGCTSATLSDDVVIPNPPSAPSAPVIGVITQPTCTVATGSVGLTGLPSAGSWTVTVSPGGRTIAGSGTTLLVSSLSAGTYTFSVTISNGCVSAPSTEATINSQPVTPTPPVIGTITQPTCVVATGSVVLNSLPSTGSWIITRNPGSITTSGSGTSTTISGLNTGTYTFTVTNSSGCTSSPSSNVVIDAQPPSPAVPTYNIDCTLGFNHAVITITSPLGSNYQYSLDGGAYQTSNSFPEIANGNHFIAVRTLQGCTTVGGIFAVSCGCINPPTLILSSESGSSCGTAPTTVKDNIFGGTATSVTITEDGAGSVSPANSNVSPFSFTYTPANGDRGKTIHITITTDNPLGSPCSAATATYTLIVNDIPSAPVVGTITSLTCTTTTGSVVLNGLPSSGTWTLIRNPGNVATNGTGTTITVTDLLPGTYTFTVTNEAGCTSPQSANVVINPQPDAPQPPIIGEITQPTCGISTGSVKLSGLPATGTWILTRQPGNVSHSGTGTDYTALNVPSGTYTYTVTNAAGCISNQSESFVINPQPATPTAPSIGTITPPTCLISTGSVILFGLPSSGTWTVTRYPGTVKITGTGTRDTITTLPSGTYNFTVTNASGCVSVASSDVVIPAQPPTPTPPVVGIITQPTYTLPTGSVSLSGLPSSGSWILTRLPDSVTTNGAGSSFNVSGLNGGLYHFTVTNSIGCTSDTSKKVIISTLGPPKLVITDPPSVCYPGTVDLTSGDITTGSTSGLTFTYWLDEEATIEYTTPTSATQGTYYIKGTTVSGYFSIAPVNVKIDQMPVANAGPDQYLALQSSTSMEASLEEDETGVWKIISGNANFADTTDPRSVVSDLPSGDNIMEWIVTRGACPADTAKVTIKVGDVMIPTIITPNGDSKNEYFVVVGLSHLGKCELIIFDRRGSIVYRNSNYDNKWNGVDEKENPLANDTYFYVLNSSKGRSIKGYVMIRR
jgi:gliding motility-associated-like protein